MPNAIASRWIEEADEAETLTSLSHVLSFADLGGDPRREAAVRAPTVPDASYCVPKKLSEAVVSRLPRTTVTRHLAAIVAIQVHDHSRLMAEDEDGTHDRLKTCLREIIGPRVNQQRGRVVKNTGDQILAEFSSVVDAVVSAAEIQHDIADRN